MESQVLVIISPRNTVSQLYPRALGPPCVEFEVILRPTVSRASSSWCLAPLTRCYIHFNDNYFLYSSCKATCLTRGRVRNLQCNEASSISSYIVADGLSASSSWCRAPNGAHNQILISLAVISSSRCRAPSPISPMNRVIQPKVKSQSHVSAGRNFQCCNWEGCISKSKSHYDRQAVGQSVLVSCSHLGPATNFSFSLRFSFRQFLFVIL
jgi:hypothetical protein